MEIKTYILVFYNPALNIDSLNKWILYSPYVITYWNYLPGIYCIKSTSHVNELRAHFEPVLGMQNFLIAEINPQNLSGRLPQEAWPWFYQTTFPPKPSTPGTQTTPETVGTDDLVKAIMSYSRPNNEKN